MLISEANTIPQRLGDTAHGSEERAELALDPRGTGQLKEQLVPKAVESGILQGPLDKAARREAARRQPRGVQGNEREIAVTKRGRAATRQGPNAS